MITAVGLIAVPVKDPDAALQFYTKKLGFKIVTDQEFGEGARWIELRIPGADTYLALQASDEADDRVGSFTNISFACKDVEKTYAELKERGVEFEGPPEKAPWGITAVFKDIDGNSFCLATR